MLKLTERLSVTDPGDHEDQLELPFDERKRGRLKAVTAGGLEAGIFIERGDAMRDGTRLRAETGEIVLIKAAPEQVSTAVCTEVGEQDALTFARVCYHLGNRHVPLQIGDGWVRYHQDHVLDEMVGLLGCTVIREEVPFEPENGAYSGHGHNHSHSHSHSHKGGHHHEH